jgi:hypothetical protein
MEETNAECQVLEGLVQPAIPVKFVQEMFVINALGLFSTWLDESDRDPARHMRIEIRCLFNALDWAVDYTMTAKSNDGRVYAHQEPDPADFITWLLATYRLADSLGYSLDVA